MDFGRLDQFFQPIQAIPAILPSTVSGGTSISRAHWMISPRVPSTCKALPSSVYSAFKPQASAMHFSSPLHAGNAAFIFVLPLVILFFCGRLFFGPVAWILAAALSRLGES